MMRFNHARQGKGPRLPRSGRTALIGSVLAFGVPYSQFFYPPQARPDPVRVERVIPEKQITESALRVTMQLEEIPDNSLAADLCRRILRAQAMTTAARAKEEHQNDKV